MRSLSASLAATAALAAVAAASSCYDGLYMIVARGTDEVPGPGSMGAVADLVASKIPHSKVIGVPYPATFNHYTESEYDGAKEVRLMAMSYASECPGKKMALLGYSQGAQATCDAVCGGSEASFPNVTALSSSVEKDIVAVVLYGNPSFIANQTGDRGTAKHDGIFPRSNLTLCNEYSNKMISYCDSNDPYCDSGQNDTVHHLYVTLYGNQSADYIIQKFDQAVSSSPSSTASASLSSSTSSASSSATVAASSSSSSASASASATTTKAPAKAAAVKNAIPALTLLLGSSIFGLALTFL